MNRPRSSFHRPEPYADRQAHAKDLRLSNYQARQFAGNSLPLSSYVAKDQPEPQPKKP